MHEGAEVEVPVSTNLKEEFIMKRKLFIRWLICFALGIAIGSQLTQAIQYSSVESGVLAIIAIVALVLFNIAFGYDSETND